MSWDVRLGERVHRVGPEGLVIGRAAECDIVLKEPEVSRRHAVIRPTPSGLIVEDCGSRHGVMVNGITIAGTERLRHGDRVAIAGCTLLVTEVARREREQEPTVQAPKPKSLRDGVPTGDFDLHARFLTETEAALERGESSGVRQGVGALFIMVRNLELAGGAEGALLTRHSVLALRAAVAIGQTSWVDEVVALHAMRKRVMQTAVLETLAVVLERLPNHPRVAIQAYYESLRVERARMTTYELFCLARLAAVLASPA